LYPKRVSVLILYTHFFLGIPYVTVIAIDDEVKAGGKEGVGRGFASFLQHVVGGTFFFVGKATGSMSKVIDSVTSNDLTSKHLKPDFASHRNRPRNAPEGIVQGTDFLARTIIYGVVSNYMHLTFKF
jgi:hypothetical protein